MALSINAAKADRRVAFVVGNGAYRNVAQLPNPPIDAKLMANTLRSVGFEVIEGTNLTRDKMTEKLLDFGNKAAGADIAVFYYAGHGIAISGTNYLLPIDADIKSEMDVKLGTAINVDLTLDQTMGDAKVKLVFLDACRDNPFAAKIRSASKTRSVNVQSGLAEMKSGEGTLIAFATGPGQTALDGQEGANSPFTRALVDNITKPGIEIQQAMTSVRAQVNEETHKGQLPWGHTNLIGTVYLGPVPTQTQMASATPAGNIAPATSMSDAANVELEFWRTVKDSNKPEELNAYVTAYPNGQFKPLAEARIAAIQNGASTASRALNPNIDPATYTEEATQLTEDQIGLNKDQRKDMQRRLTGLGFDTEMTGVFNDETRTVINRWQAARGYPVSGYFNKLQHRALLSEPVALATPSASLPTKQPARRRSTASAQRQALPPPPPVQRGPDPAGAAFMGAVVGGMMGNAFRHR